MLKMLKRDVLQVLLCMFALHYCNIMVLRCNKHAFSNQMVPWPHVWKGSRDYDVGQREKWKLPG